VIDKSSNTPDSGNIKTEPLSKYLRDEIISPCDFFANELVLSIVESRKYICHTTLIKHLDVVGTNYIKKSHDKILITLGPQAHMSRYLRSGNIEVSGNIDTQ
jgi:hypothetical protein